MSGVDITDFVIKLVHEQYMLSLTAVELDCVEPPPLIFAEQVYT